MHDQDQEEVELKPLKVTCTSSDCGSNLHCFRTKKKMATGMPRSGPCRRCGADLVKWNRVHQRRLSDVQYTFQALRLEMIRHYFWHLPVPLRALNHARRKGKLALDKLARKQLRTLVGSARHVREGYQTPRETSSGVNVVHLGQHATASCCRKCIAEWHGIPEARALSDDELQYLAELVMLYVSDRIPDLLETPVYVAPIRRRPKTI